MQSPEKRPDGNTFGMKNISLAVVAGQAGCLTLLVVFVAVFLGLWLDNKLDTKPVITLILVILSIPVSVLAMLKLVRTAVSKIQPAVQLPGKQPQEDRKIGRYEED